MHHLNLIQDLGIVLAMAAVMGLLARRLCQPPVLGYLIAGLLVGPYIPVPVFADAERTHAMSELGIVLVMFVVGLELRLKRLLTVLPTAGATAVIEVTAMLAAGFALGSAMGWSAQGSLFLGASVCISSTMIVSNVFSSHDVGEPLRRFVMSVLVIQDVLAIVLAAVLTAVAAGQGLGAMDVGLVVGRLGGELVAAVIIGLFIVPPLIRRVIKTRSRELLVVVCAGLCFALAFGAYELGYSVALGAFLAGVLVAESGSSHEVEHAMAPIRDLFASVFFVSIGMTVDPLMALQYAPASLAAFGVVLIVQLVAVSLAGILSGNGLRPSVRAGLSLGQVGEFGFILSAIGIEAGVAPPELAPIVVSVAVLTTFSSPLTIRASDAVVRRLDHMLPARLQLMLSLYTAWLERLRSPTRAAPATRSGVRLLVVLALEGLAVSGLVIVGTAMAPALGGWVESATSVQAPWGRWVVTGACLVLGIAPVWGFVLASRAYSRRVGLRVFGEATGQHARVRALLEPAIQTLLVLAFGLPCAAIVLPTSGPWAVLGVLVSAIIPAGMAWRAAGRADDEIRSSAHRFVDLVSARMTDDDDEASSAPAEEEAELQEVLGATPLHLHGSAVAVGRTLAELDLRARTGASVLAIQSASGDRRVPAPHQPLEAGDTLMLAGPELAVQAAKRVLTAA
ncbi:MAG: cation:proton antiporter [Myxococcota bacterium]